MSVYIICVCVFCIPAAAASAGTNSVTVPMERTFCSLALYICSTIDGGALEALIAEPPDDDDEKAELLLALLLLLPAGVLADDDDDDVAAAEAGVAVALLLLLLLMLPLPRRLPAGVPVVAVEGTAPLSLSAAETSSRSFFHEGCAVSNVTPEFFFCVCACMHAAGKLRLIR